MAVCLATKAATASRLRRRPRLVGNSGPVGWLWRSVSQECSTETVWAVRGRSPLFPAFAVTTEVGSSPEVNVSAAQPGELGDSQPGLDGDHQQGVIAPADPAVAVGSGEQGVDLFGFEEGDVGALGAFGGDGEHPSDQRGVFGVFQRRVSVEGVDGRQAGVAGSDAVVTVSFEMVQEGPDERGVEIVEVEIARRPSGSLRGETEQQTERVSVGGDGVAAGSFLVDESLGEEAFQGGGERGHGSAFGVGSRRRAARASSSGTAETYQ